MGDFEILQAKSLGSLLFCCVCLFVFLILKEKIEAETKSTKAQPTCI